MRTEVETKQNKENNAWTKWEFQEEDVNYKTPQVEVLVLKWKVH